MITNAQKIQPAEGKIGVLLVGMGAVSTTFIAGVELIRKKHSKAIGAMTQIGHIRLGKRTESKNPLIKDFIPLADLEDLVFAVWDIFPDNAKKAAKKAGVLSNEDIDKVGEFLEKISPMKAVFDQNFVKNIQGGNIKTETNKMALAEALMKDMEEFKNKNKLSRLVVIWCASTESYIAPSDAHQSLEKFELALKNSDSSIAPSMIYAYAALKIGVPFCNGAPNLTLDIPALQELALEKHVPISGKDFKTGQTLMKTILAPGFKARYLGLSGWFSTNILGNRDGEVLDDPGSFKSKEESKLGVLDTILQPEIYPELYGNIYHKVRINYYPPRGDNKEGWDNIDIFGWMGYPMQVKVDFLCRDSILAAPLVLDLILFTDFAQRAGLRGIQDWLSFYYKSPMTTPNLSPEHNIFVQEMKLKNTLRYLMGEERITHLGLEYYE